MPHRMTLDTVNFSDEYPECDCEYAECELCNPESFLTMKGEDVDEGLRRMGLDPEAIGQRGAALVSGLLKKRRATTSHGEKL